MSSGHAETEDASYGRTAQVLTLAYGTAGALTYIFLAICSHKLSADDYGAVAVLWTAVFITFSTICRPIESLLSRSIAEADAREHSRRPIVASAAKIQLLLAGGFVVVALAARGVIEDTLFDGDPGIFFWAFLVAVVGFSLDFFARGYLAGRRLFGIYSGLLIAEAGSRVLFALPLAAGLVASTQLEAMAVIAAPFCSLLPVWAGLWLLRRDRAAPRPPTRAGEVTPLSRSGTFTLSVVVILFCEQLFVSAGPLFVRSADGAAQAGFVFNELVLAIAPLLLFQAVLTALLPHLTRLRSRGASGFEESIRDTLLAICAFAALALIVVGTVGPTMMQIAFGDNFDYSRSGLLTITVGMGFYLASTTLNQAALARGRASAAAALWAICAAGFLLWNLLAPIGQVSAVEAGFAGASAVLFVLLGILHRRHASEEATDLPEVQGPGLV